MSDRDVLTIVGSVRADSWNQKFAAAVVELGIDGVSFEIVRSDLPIYDGDTDGDAAPDEVVALRERVATADGLLIVTPEYNYGIPGPLKNTLDWLSRPAFRSVLRDLPVTSMGSSPGPSGATRAVGQLQSTLIAVAAAVLPWPALTIAHVGDALEGGSLDHQTAHRARRQLEAFVDWIDAVESYRGARVSR